MLITGPCELIGPESLLCISVDFNTHSLKILLDPPRVLHFASIFLFLSPVRRTPCCFQDYVMTKNILFPPYHNVAIISQCHHRYFWCVTLSVRVSVTGCARSEIPEPPRNARITSVGDDYVIYVCNLGYNPVNATVWPFLANCIDNKWHMSAGACISRK